MSWAHQQPLPPKVCPCGQSLQYPEEAVPSPPRFGFRASFSAQNVSVLHILPPWNSVVSLPPALLLGPWLLLNPLSTLEPTVSSPHSQSAPYPGATSTPPTCS